MTEKISIIIITHNEEKNIKECLESVKWADEIILVDAQSTDATVKIAKNYTDKVFILEWEGYAKAKNFALENVSHKWVFAIDADERVTPELRNEIINIISSPNNRKVAYKVARRTYFLGKWIKHCGWYPNYVTRLFRTGYGMYSNLNVHEKLEVEGETGFLKNDLLHYTDNNLFQYFTKFNQYTSLAAKDLQNANKKFSIINLLIRPIFTFIKMYIIKLGFLDGMHGFILCALSSYYVFVKYAKMWENTKIKGD